MKHPLCKNDKTCTNAKCGFFHTGGRRYTGAVSTDGVKQIAQETNLCWKKHKCSDAQCELIHPQCKDGSLCKNTKCGFEHPNGWRYTSSMICLPVESSTDKTEGLLSTCNPYDIFCREESFDLQPPLVDNSVHEQKVYDTGKYVKANGDITLIEQDKGIAWMKPTMLHQFASHPEFYSAIQKCPNDNKVSISLVHENRDIAECITQGDSVSVHVFLDNCGRLHAKEVSFVRINFLARDCDDVTRLVKITTAPSSICEDTIRLILSHNALSRDIVAVFLLHTQWAWADSTQLRRARRLSTIIMGTPFLAQGGCFSRQLPLLKTRELMAAADMIGCICILDPKRIPSVVHAARQTASFLGANGINFLGDILQAMAIAMSPDTALSNYEWWQLPNVPTEQEISSIESSYGVTDMKSLPSVLVGEVYDSVAEYLSTYMRLHRADCFLPFVQSIQKNFHKGEDNNTDIMDVLVLERVTVCGINLSASTGEMDFQLQCNVQNSSALRHDSLSLTNTLCISLRGDFKDDHLLWGVISIAPESRPRVGSNGSKTLPVVFGIRLCTSINHIPDDEVFRQLYLYHETLRLMENPLSFVSCEPILNAMRSYWRPGRTLYINFQDSLLRGKAISSSEDERNTFLKFAKDKGVFDSLDVFQKEAFVNVANNSFSLIQGPPGCGKSYVGSRLGQVLVSQYKRILVATSKNHSLDELLIDISRILAMEGQSKVVRVGNEKKIATELKPHSLPALLTAINGAMSSCDQKSMVDLARKFNKLCRRLRESVQLTWSNFERFAGSDGTAAILYHIGSSLNVCNSYKTAPPYLVDFVNKILYEWSKPVIDSIIEESVKYWHDTVAGFSHEILEDTDDTGLVADFCGFGDIHPNSLLGIITAHSVAGSQAMFIPQMDVSFMWSWGEESKRNFILLVLHNEFREITERFLDLSNDLPALKDSVKESRIKCEINLLKSASVIGSTVLGVLLNIDALSASRPEVLLLEEAGEVSESALISILRIPSLRKCILIGDHQQLRPTVNSHQLRVHKKYDISCFERLVSLNMPCTMLKTQNRMLHEVLLPVQLHYSGITSNSSLNLPRVSWLHSALFWWVCESPGEKQHASWYNAEQGHRATQLANFLIKQEAVPPQRITILVPYSSQQLFVQDLLRRNQNGDVIVSTIDQYQGDENDIIILTLVRCDHENPSKIGFLGLTNRMIVATSRQKRALIIIGSEQCFGTNETWKLLQDELKRDDKIGEGLPLCCPRHPSIILRVRDSTCMPNSGCGTKCGSILSCHHQCSSLCHPGDLHGKCKVMVDHTFSPCNHRFQYQCHAVQKLCPSKVQRKLKCGHTITDSCGRYHSLDQSLPECNTTCEFSLPCSHKVWLKCGSSIDGYVSPEFNACPECIMPIEIRSFLSSPKVNSSKRGDRAYLDSTGEASLEDLRLIADTVSRENLCDADKIAMLEVALQRARLPKELLKLSIPENLIWDPTVSHDEKRQTLEQFNTRQQLWHVLLQESAVSVPINWQRNPLSMIAALAIDSEANKRSRQMRSDEEFTKAELFYKRICQLREAKIETASDFIGVLKQADECLYKALSDHASSKEAWYDRLEGNLAKSVTACLLAKTASSSQNGSQKVVIKRFLSDCHHMDEARKSSLNLIRTDWQLPSCQALDLSGPPYNEISQEFLYQSSLQGLYLSVDLKSADFYILRIATSMINAGTWEDWVAEIVPDLTKKIPFIGNLKPLRVRVLGKVLHKKNAILQYHFIRLFVRLLLSLASEHEQFRICIDRAFQFSCDELCLKLKDSVTLSEAGHLHQVLSDVIDQLRWGNLMPVRLEIFNLVMMPITDDVQRRSNRVDIKSQVNDIHLGHPALRGSAQFVDLPAIHDPAWEKPKWPDCDHDSDSYFVRQIYSVSDLAEANYTIELKMISKGLRPSAILQFMSTMNDSDRGPDGISTLSTNAKEFVPSAEKLLAHAHGFIPHKSLSSNASDFVPRNLSMHPLSSDASNFVPRNLSPLSDEITAIPPLSSNASNFVPRNVSPLSEETTAIPTLSSNASDFVPRTLSNLPEETKAIPTLSANAISFNPTMKTYGSLP
ncbi:hypothetical protein ACHAWX_007163 [Stephanocyclus meneghinianus]